MAEVMLGFNCNCFTNRYDEPEVWTKICQDLGIRYVMFNIDLIDPNWPWELQQRLCDKTLDACAKHNITIKANFGGQHTHRHFLGHPDEECRREAEMFFKRAMRQTAYLGGDSFGTCFAILTDKSNKDPKLRKKILEDAVDAYHRLAVYGKEIGLKALAYETTSVPRETCATFEENDYVLSRCSDMEIPLRICLDLGHRYLGGIDEEKSYIEWIKRYGDHCTVIDCQQTDLNGSRHWPFTDGYNEKGIIDGDEVSNAIRRYCSNDVLLAFELRTSAFYPHDERHLENLEVSVKYWRRWVSL